MFSVHVQYIGTVFTHFSEHWKCKAKKRLQVIRMNQVLHILSDIYRVNFVFFILCPKSFSITNFRNILTID